MISEVKLGAIPVSLSDARGTRATHQLENVNGERGAKIRKAAQDFEAVLLGHWLEQAEMSFATVPGGSPDENADPGHDQFQSIALQAVAGRLSGASSGLGIASLITRHLDAPMTGDPNVLSPNKLSLPEKIGPEPAPLKKLR